MALLKQVNQFSDGLSIPTGKNRYSRYIYPTISVVDIILMCLCMWVPFVALLEQTTVSLTCPFTLVPPFGRLLSMSPDVRMARMTSLENMLGMSSVALKAMASQLSDAEERERTLNNRGRWNQLRSMGDAKNVLQYLFNAAAEARCLHNLKRI